MENNITAFLAFGALILIGGFLSLANEKINYWYKKDQTPEDPEDSSEGRVYPGTDYPGSNPTMARNHKIPALEAEQWAGAYQG